MAEFPEAGSEFGWRKGPLSAVLRLRPPTPHASPAERELLQSHARGAHVAVEIGVAEGGSGAAIREVIDPTGTLYLIDPYPPGRLGIGLARLTARRVLGAVPRGRVEWVRLPSGEAVTGWERAIDFMFIDGDNSFEGVARDWADWSPHVRPGGVIAFQGARFTDDNWVAADYGPARLFREQVRDDPAWEAVDGADAVVVVRRVAPDRTTRFRSEERTEGVVGRHDVAP